MERDQNISTTTIQQKYGLDLSLFLIRLGLAAVFIVHGFSKISAMENTVLSFGKMGLPAVIAYLVGCGEFLGGLGMLFGVLAKWAGYGLSVIMLGAIIKVKIMNGVPFSGGKGPSWEFDFVLLLMALVIVLSGPGSFALEQFMRKKK